MSQDLPECELPSDAPVDFKRKIEFTLETLFDVPGITRQLFWDKGMTFEYANYVGSRSVSSPTTITTVSDTVNEETKTQILVGNICANITPMFEHLSLEHEDPKEDVKGMLVVSKCTEGTFTAVEQTNFSGDWGTMFKWCRSTITLLAEPTEENPDRFVKCVVTTLKTHENYHLSPMAEREYVIEELKQLADADTKPEVFVEFIRAACGASGSTTDCPQ
jgi:hypothetical protein